MAWVDPRTWVALEKVSAAKLNTVRDALKAIGDPWTSYSPAWQSSGTAPAVGNGTLTGAWLSAGKLTIGRIRLTSGTTTTYGTGVYNFTLPTTLKTGLQWEAIGSCSVRNQADTTSYGLAAMSASGTVISAADGAGSRLGQTFPITPTAATANYRISFFFVLEAA